MAHVFLALAIISEVVATTSLKLADGFSRLGPSIVVVVGYVAAFLLLSQAMTRGLGIGIAYGIWAALGIALVTLVGVVVLGERVSLVQIGGIVLVILGVLALELGAEH